MAYQKSFFFVYSGAKFELYKTCVFTSEMDFI